MKGGDEFLHRLAVLSQAGWKDPPIPPALHDGAAIARELVRQILLRAFVTFAGEVCLTLRWREVDSNFPFRALN